MKIQLVNPAMGKRTGERYVRSWSMQPLNIAVLSALTPDEHEVSFMDDRFDEVDYDVEADLVAIPVETYTARRAYSIARRFQDRGVPVVLGGIQASLVPEEVAAHGDSVMVGDAEHAWARIVTDAARGELRPRYDEARTSGELAHVRPDRSIYGERPYLPLAMVEAGRGCPFNCDFCAIAGSYESTYRAKDIDAIVEDVAGLDSDLLYFVDDNFVSRPRRTRELAAAIRALDKRWFSHGSITMANDDDLLARMAESGCANILIGFESLDQATLEAMGKSWNTRRYEYGEALAKLRDHGITVYGTFVFGYDTQTLDDVKRTLEFAIEERLCLAAFNHLVPFPGTPLYRRLRAEGRLLDDDWWLSDEGSFGEVTFRPRNMTAEKLAEACYDARRDFYRFGSVLRRARDFKANLRDPYSAFTYFAVNLVSNKGIKRRQGWPVGREDDGAP
ncbi:MAG: radical SAM protein [Gemmatimonadota bacterium]